MLISQPISRCLTNHSELCMPRLLNNQPRRISIYRRQWRPSFGFESSVSSTPMTSGDPVAVTTELSDSISCRNYHTVPRSLARTESKIFDVAAAEVVGLTSRLFTAALNDVVSIVLIGRRQRQTAPTRVMSRGLLETRVANRRPTAPRPVCTVVSPLGWLWVVHLRPHSITHIGLQDDGPVQTCIASWNLAYYEHELGGLRPGGRLRLRPGLRPGYRNGIWLLRELASAW